MVSPLKYRPLRTSHLSWQQLKAPLAKRILSRLCLIFLLFSATTLTLLYFFYQQWQMQLADALTFRLLPQELEAVASTLPSIEHTLYLQLIVLCTFFIILFICTAIWLSLRIIGPVVHLKKSMQRIAQGDLTTRVELRHHDAFHDVAHSLNNSTARIQVLVMGLKENIAALEKQCQSKTQQQSLAAIKQNLAYFDTLHTAEMDS